MDVRLLVVRTADPKKLSDFYSLLGLSFEYHKHGTSPYHFSAMVGATVLEIYPLARNQSASDPNLRLGFTLDDFDRIVEVLHLNEVKFHSGPIQTEFGYLVIVEDPDGRKLELYKAV